MEGLIARPRLLDEMVADYQARPLPALLRRNGSLAQVKGKADVVIGMRRSGKT